MIGIEVSDSILNGVYGSYTAKVNSLVSSIYLENADTYTGKSAMQTFLRSEIAENKANVASVDDGNELVEKNQVYVEGIRLKLADMLEIAEETDSGVLTSAELADRQAQLEALAGEIDDIAQGPLGETHILTEDGNTESVFIGGGLSIQIDTHDMDSDSGLGLGGIDVTADTAAAVATIETAISEVEAYSDHLEGKHASLEASSTVLEIQSASLLAVDSAVGSMNSALMIAGMISAEATTMSNFMVLAQANSMADTVLNLLAD